MGFLPALTLVFIILKLCEVVAWSWLVVLSPMLIGLLIWLIALVILVATST